MKNPEIPGIPNCTLKDLAQLEHMSRARQAIELLSGALGPMKESGYPVDTAGMAYLVWLFHRMSRADGMLKNFTAWEAKDKVCNVFRSAVACTTTAKGLPTQLGQRLNARPEKMDPRDILWWAEFSATFNARQWLRMSGDPAFVDDVLTAFRLLSEWLWQVRKLFAETNEEELSDE